MISTMMFLAVVCLASVAHVTSFGFGFTPKWTTSYRNKQLNMADPRDHEVFDHNERPPSCTATYDHYTDVLDRLMEDDSDTEAEIRKNLMDADIQLDRHDAEIEAQIRNGIREKWQDPNSDEWKQRGMLKFMVERYYDYQSEINRDRMVDEEVCVTEQEVVQNGGVNVFAELRKQLGTEAYDMLLLGNLQRLFVDEVVDPILQMSWEVGEQMKGRAPEFRSYSSYLWFLPKFAIYVACKRDPNPLNNAYARYANIEYNFNVTARLELVDRALVPLTGVNILDVGLAFIAYSQHTYNTNEVMFSKDLSSRLEFIKQCELCEWREEWRDLAVKMTRAVRGKLESNKIQLREKAE